MKFIMNRTHTVASRSGHVIAFEKGIPTYVPKEVRHEAIAAGAIPAEDGDEVSFDEPLKPMQAPDDPVERDELILMACADVKKRDTREDFTATGVPKAAVIKKIVGFDVAAREVGDVWAKMNQAAAE
jgi:hypothetical protein